jgi:hypothetical protein
MKRPQTIGITHETLPIVQVDKIHMFLSISVKSIDIGVASNYCVVMAIYCVLKAGNLGISVFRSKIEPGLFHTN